MQLNIALLILMTITSLWAVMGSSLLKATIGLAVTSAIITILMFRLDSPLAAVFELSVCAGLITVVFISTISLTKPLTHQEVIERSRERWKRYWPLPIIITAVGIGLAFMNMPKDLSIFRSTSTLDVRQVLWNLRQLDIFGQIIIIIAGALGIVVLFEEKKSDEW
jgi:NADH-quinone oxidoreductase subunit J